MEFQQMALLQLCFLFHTLNVLYLCLYLYLLCVAMRNIALPSCWQKIWLHWDHHVPIACQSVPVGAPRSMDGMVLREESLTQYRAVFLFTSRVTQWIRLAEMKLLVDPSYFRQFVLNYSASSPITNFGDFLHFGEPSHSERHPPDSSFVTVIAPSSGLLRCISAQEEMWTQNWMSLAFFSIFQRPWEL